MIDLKVYDKQLVDNAEGRFLLAIGEAIVALEIDNLLALQIDPYPILDAKTARPSIAIAPQVETTPRDPRLGIYSVNYQASLTLTTDAIGDTSPNMAWQLKTRHSLMKRFSGSTSATALIEYEGDCFAVSVRAGVRFDPRARKAGRLLSVLFITGLHVEEFDV